MPTRRFFLASALPVALSAPSFAASGESFAKFVDSVRAEARRNGIRPATLDSAFAGVVPNQKVLDRDHHQPESTWTWARYRGLVVTDKRITEGREAFAANRALFQRVEQHYGVGSGVIAGIWGLESSFGSGTGDFRVVEALSTLAWEGRRASFFRGELMAALKILDHGDVAPGAMTGSYAGAMGQPQFMPSSYLRYAVDFEGHGRRDIWNSKADVLGSIANYLAQSGWRANETWGQAVSVPPNTDAAGPRCQTPAIRMDTRRRAPAQRPLGRTGRYAGRIDHAGRGRGRGLRRLRQLCRDTGDTTPPTSTRSPSA